MCMIVQWLWKFIDCFQRFCCQEAPAEHHVHPVPASRHYKLPSQHLGFNGALCSFSLHNSTAGLVLVSPSQQEVPPHRETAGLEKGLLKTGRPPQPASIGLIGEFVKMPRQVCMGVLPGCGLPIDWSGAGLPLLRYWAWFIKNPSLLLSPNSFLVRVKREGLPIASIRNRPTGIVSI